MDLKPPTWLTKDFIRSSLEDGKNTSDILSVENIKIDMPIALGNNYSGCIYRVKAEYLVKDVPGLQNKTVYLKVPHEGGMYDFFAQLGITKKEFIVYHELIPKYKSIFGKKWDDLTPKSFYSQKDNIVILEDLNEKGYVMADRIKQLNFEECVIALSSLAKFHAASVKLYEVEPELIKKAGEEAVFREEMKQVFEGMFKGAIINAVTEYENLPDIKKYVASIRKFSENLMGKFEEMIKIKQDEFNVLNHGDFWTTNMMFKYVNNKPVDIKLIDLQMTRYASPALDIIYFMNTSVKEEIRAEKYDELLNIYLEKLNTYLEIFGNDKRLSKIELNKAIEDRGIFAVQITLGSLPLFIADVDKDITVEIKELSMDDMMKADNPMTNSMTKCFKNEKYLKILAKRLKEFEIKGWI